MKRKFFPLVFFLIFVLSSPIYAQTWTQVNEDGFGDTHNIWAFSMAEYNNDLYVGTRNDTGAEVWKYDGSWTQVNEDGFGDTHNIWAFSMAEYNNDLYVGTLNVNTGAEVRRYDGPGTWTKVNTGGFGDSDNIMALSMAEYNDRLYVGTRNDTGAEVWKYDGSNWTRVGVNGFGGDTHNTWALSMAVYNNDLYVGTGNDSTGTEVWKMYNILSSIPTLSQWGMIIFSLLLAGTAIFVLRRRLYTG